jgi:Ca2+-binding EF-hand superfamily protein
MRFSKYAMLVAVAVGAAWLTIALTSFGQDRQPPQPGARERGGDGPQRFRFGPGFALQEALDKDRDGKLSAEELKNAAASLKALDKNSDGKLNAEEIGWPPQFAAFPAGGRGRGGRGGFGRGGFGGREGAPPAEFNKRIMARDANKDGQVTAAELPRSMISVLKLADQNQDGAIDEAEAEKFAKRHGAVGRATPPNRPAQPERQP